MFKRRKLFIRNNKATCLILFAFVFSGCDSIKEKLAFNAALVKDGEMYVEWHQQGKNNLSQTIYYKFSNGKVVDYNTDVKRFEKKYLMTIKGVPYYDDYNCLNIVESSNFNIVMQTRLNNLNEGEYVENGGSLKKSYNNSITIDIKGIEEYTGGEGELDADITLKECVFVTKNKFKMETSNFKGKVYIYIPNYKGNNTSNSQKNTEETFDQESITEEEILQSEAAGGM